MTGAAIDVVGLGPAGPDLITARTEGLLGSGAPVHLRTRRHPAAEAVVAAGSFDDVYEAAGSFDEVYARIVEGLVDLARSHGEIVYAVPGSPRVLERTVALLIAGGADDVEIRVHPAMSFLDLVWDRLGIDPVEQRVRLVDGHGFEAAVAGEAGPVVVAHCHNRRVLSEVKLALDPPPEEPVTVLHHLGLDDEAVFAVDWAELDREVEPDHLTALWIPALADRVGRAHATFAQLVARLRRDCPWDADQSHGSLRRHLLEETYEVLEAIDAVEAGGDGDADATAYGALREELGDLLYQVFFHAHLASEQGRFDAADVAEGITGKLVDRHPHVFGDVEVTDADEVLGNWEASKLVEKGRSSVMDGIPTALPGALYLAKVAKKARGAGLDPRAEATAVLEGADPAAVELFEVVLRCLDAGVDPESALREAATALRDHTRDLGK